MAASLVLGEYLAGAVVGLMLAGGNALEDYAAGHARRELRSLVARAPQSAQRVGNVVEEVPVEELAVGDTVVVRGRGRPRRRDRDERRGRPRRVDPHWRAAAGVLQGRSAGAQRLGECGRGLRAEGRRGPRESAYAAIVRLVQQAESQKAPFVRLADRYAAVFLPVTLAAAGLLGP